MSPAEVGPAPATNSWVNTTDGQKIEAWDFDASATNEEVQFTLTMPENWDAGTVKVKYYWTAVNATSGDVSWGIAGGSLANGDFGGTNLGAIVLTTNSTADMVGKLNISAASAAITIGGAPSGGHLCWFNLFRDTCSLTNDARLLGLWLQYRRSFTSTSW